MWCRLWKGLFSKNEVPWWRGKGSENNVPDGKVPGPWIMHRGIRPFCRVRSPSSPTDLTYLLFSRGPWFSWLKPTVPTTFSQQQKTSSISNPMYFKSMTIPNPGEKYERKVFSALKVFHVHIPQCCFMLHDLHNCGYMQTWNLSKILHCRIFRLKLLHCQFHLISTVLVRKNTKNEWKWRNLHRWQKFYTAVGSDGIDKFHLWLLSW